MNKKINVLIVEDQKIISTPLVNQFTSAGYKITAVIESGEEVVKQIDKLNPDIILMDVILDGEMTGIEAAKIILKNNELPIIFLSGKSKELSIEDLLVNGVYGYISKQESFEEINFSLKIALHKFKEVQKTKYDKYFLTEAQKIANIGHWKLIHQTGELSWSDETYNIFRKNKNLFTPTYDDFLKILHPEDTELLKKNFSNSVINKTTYEFEHRIIIENEIRYVIEKGKTFYSKKGNPDISIGTVQDITSTYLTTSLLKQSESNFREIFSNSIDEVYIIDMKSLSFIEVNKTAQKKIGYSSSEFIEKSVFDIIGNSDDIKEVISRLLKERVGVEVETDTFHKTKIGCEYPVNIKIKKIRYNNSIVYLVLASDTSHAKLLETERKEQFQVREITNDLLSIRQTFNDLNKFYSAILNKVLELPFLGDNKKGTLFITNKNGDLELKVGENISDITRNTCALVKSGICSCGTTLATKKSQFSSCEIGTEEKLSPEMEGLSNYNIPIIHNNEVQGVYSLYTDNLKQKNINYMDILETIGKTIGLLIVRMKDHSELLASENKFRELTETIKEVFWLLDWETKKLLYISPAYEDLYEEPCESMYNNPKSWKLKIHPDDSEKVTELYRTRSIHSKYDIEFRIVMKDERIKWVHESAFPIFENGEIIKMAGYSVDITEKKRIECELIKNEERFRMLYNNNLSGLFRIDIEGKIIECNDAFANIIEYETREKVINLFVNDIFKSSVDMINLLKESNGELKSYSSTIKLKNGKEVRLLENAKLFYDDSNNVIFYEGSIFDTTSLYEIEKEKRMIEVIPAENPNPVLRLDYDLNIIYENDASKNLLKISMFKQKRLAQFITNIVAEDKNQSNIEIRIDKKYYIFYAVNIKEHGYINLYGTDITALENSKAAHFELTLDLERLVDIRTKELKITVNKLNTEIIERQKAEDEIKRSLSEKEVLLNEITHRVKNNLQVISSLLSLQQNNIENKETINLLVGTGHRIKSMALIHETLYKGGNFSEINFKTYLESLVRYISSSFEMRHIKLNLEFTEGALSIEVATSCGMILMELITNSIKYAFPNEGIGEIFLNFDQSKDGTYCLKIEDNGIGLPEGFDIDKSDSLGMQLVFGLTSQIDGKVEVKSSTKGTSVKILFKDKKRVAYEK